MNRTNIILIALVVVLSISLISNLSYANQDCSLSVFHIKQIDSALDCLAQRDNQQVAMIDATNMMIEERLKPIEEKLLIRNATDTDIITEPDTNSTGVTR